ncbi:MAG: ABC transporter permease [Aerococcus sp.]|nr:ABC transporter permease [Aerococcus sp.]
MWRLIEQLFPKRRAQQQQQIFRYFKYIFNDHFVVALMFLFGALMFQYAKWVEVLPNTPHPTAWLWLWVVVMTLLVRFGRLATYITEADLVFLLPAEERVADYMASAFRYSLLLPAGVLFLALLASVPFLRAVTVVSWPMLAVLFVTLLLMKGIDLRVQSENGHHHTTQERLTLRFGVSIVNLTLLSVGVLEQPLIALALTGSFYLGLRWFIRPFAAGRMWDWAYLLDQESSRQQTIQTILGLFVETQKGEQAVHRRRLFDRWLPKFSKSTALFNGLYWREFFRMGAWLGLWSRLLAVGGVLLCFLPVHPLSWGVGALLLVLSGIQLLPLANTYDRHPLLNTYPIDFGMKSSAFQRFLGTLLFIQVVIFSLLLTLSHWGQWQYNVIGTFILLVVAGAFIYAYVPKRLNQPRRRVALRR